MNQAFDYNGVVVAQSAPKKVLKTIKKTIHIDSADRDTTKYYTNGDFWVYLPRNYSNIVSIRLKDAQFPPLVAYPSATSGATSVATSGGYATFTVGSTSGMLPGNAVSITSATTTPAYNGTYIIQSVPSGTTFIVKTSTTGTLGTATATVISPGAATHSYLSSDGLSKGQNISSGTFGGDTLITTPTYYFLVGLEGLNKVDETSVGANRSTFADSFFAKIPTTTTTYGATSFIAYNDHSTLENIATYSPPIENLDRLHITLRTHSQQDKTGFMYWTSDGGVAGSSTGNTGGAANFNLTLEVEYLENVFTDFSSFETRLSERS
jgi:hypothetical protein